MKPVANRVRAETPVFTVTSASAEVDLLRTSSRTRAAVVSAAPGSATRRSVVIALPSDPDADPAEPGRDRRMARVADLLGLALAAVRRTPERPLVAVPEHVHGAPEPRADRGVRRVLQHPDL